MMDDHLTISLNGLRSRKVHSFFLICSIC
ncbi:hypothetical protein Gotur_030940 [Gossypium turneri]